MRSIFAMVRILSALRTSPTALTTKELAAHVMAERGLNTADDRLVTLIGKRVGACLRMHRNKGIVDSKPSVDGYLVWEIARAQN